MNLKILTATWITHIEHQTRHQRRALRDHQRQETARAHEVEVQKRSVKTILSNMRHAVSESFHQQAGDLLSQHLTARTHLMTMEAHPKIVALNALLDEIARHMASLPLKRRLKFFRSSVAIVAEILAAMQREASHAVTAASADRRRISPHRLYGSSNSPFAGPTRPS